ncbi:MAG: hypothetical protein ACQCN3_11735 [Candidatus Bathyarchaeia archaeon]
MRKSHVSDLDTKEIKEILQKVNMDFDVIVNKALNSYLSKIFLVCPFTEKLCIYQKQCIGCSSCSSSKQTSNIASSIV